MASKANNKTIDAILNEATEEILGDAVVTPTAKAKESSVESSAAVEFAKKEQERKTLVTTYREEDKIAVTISPFYAPYLGKVVRQSVNGIFVDVPADGQTYKINKTHAAHILHKIKKIDAMIERQKRAGDVSKNLEHAPGELHL